MFKTSSLTQNCLRSSWSSVSVATCWLQVSQYCNCHAEHQMNFCLSSSRLSKYKHSNWQQLMRTFYFRRSLDEKVKSTKATKWSHRYQFVKWKNEEKKIKAHEQLIFVVGIGGTLRFYASKMYWRKHLAIDLSGSNQSQFPRSIRIRNVLSCGRSTNLGHKRWKRKVTKKKTPQNIMKNAKTKSSS